MQRIFLDKWWSYPNSDVEATFDKILVPISRLAVWILNFCFIWSMLLISAEHPMHIPNIFKSNSIPFFIVYLIYAAYFISLIWLWGNLIKTIFLIMSALLVILFPSLSQEFRLSKSSTKKRRFRCSSELVKYPGNISIEYRSLQIILNQMCDGFGLLFPIINALFGQAAVSVGYLLIVVGMDVLSSIIFLYGISCIVLFWSVMLTGLGSLQNVSKKCIEFWKIDTQLWENTRDRKYMGKFRKSCKPLSVGYPGVMKISHTTVLKFVQGIVRGLFRTILSLKRRQAR